MASTSWNMPFVMKCGLSAKAASAQPPGSADVVNNPPDGAARYSHTLFPAGTSRCCMSIDRQEVWHTIAKARAVATEMHRGVRNEARVSAVGVLGVLARGKGLL